jgi:hypothetical protein
VECTASLHQLRGERLVKLVQLSDNETIGDEYEYLKTFDSRCTEFLRVQNALSKGIPVPHLISLLDECAWISIPCSGVQIASVSLLRVSGMFESFTPACMALISTSTFTRLRTQLMGMGCPVILTEG